MDKPLSQKACVRTGWEYFGIPANSGDGFAYNREGIQYTRPAGQCVNATTAMQLSAVWACVTLLADTISTLPVGFYRRTDTGREPARMHPLFKVFRYQPNPDQTAGQFLGAFIASMLLRDGGFAEKVISGGQVVGLEFLVRDRLQCVRLSDTKREWRYTENGKTRVIPENKLWRVPGFTLDGKNGCSAIAYGANVFANAMAADQAASATFEGGLMPTVAFKYPQTLQKHQRDEAREAIATLAGSVNAGKPVILEAGTDAITIGINPADAQLLESRAYSTEEICSWFRVQPFMIGRSADGQTNWGTGIEQQMIGFITFTLAPWLRRIEQAITKDLLRPEEQDRYYAEFNLEGLLRGDSAARSAFYASALQNGWMNRSQVAQLENLPPPPGGDVYTVQSNLIPVTDLGKPAPSAPADPTAALKQLLGLNKD